MIDEVWQTGAGEAMSRLRKEAENVAACRLVASDLPDHRAREPGYDAAPQRRKVISTLVHSPATTRTERGFGGR